MTWSAIVDTNDRYPRGYEDIATRNDQNHSDRGNVYLPDRIQTRGASVGEERLEQFRNFTSKTKRIEASKNKGSTGECCQDIHSTLQCWTYPNEDCSGRSIHSYLPRRKNTRNSCNAFPTQPRRPKKKKIQRMSSYSFRITSAYTLVQS